MATITGCGSTSSIIIIIRTPKHAKQGPILLEPPPCRFSYKDPAAHRIHAYAISVNIVSICRHIERLKKLKQNHQNLDVFLKLGPQMRESPTADLQKLLGTPADTANALKSLAKAFLRSPGVLYWLLVGNKGIYLLPI